MEILAANLTPFSRDRKVDTGALRAHVIWMAANGIDGFLPAASSGEFLYLHWREKEEVVRTVVDAAAGRKVIAGVWDPNLALSVRLAQGARDAGAAAVLLAPPLVHRVGTAALLAWYRAVRKAVELPIFASAHPGGANSLDEPLVELLFDKAGVHGLEEGSGDLLKLRRLTRRWPGRVYVGNDRLLGDVRRLRAAAGFASSLANLYPELVVKLARGLDSGLSETLLDRLRAIRRAGGLAAMKAALGFGCRLPVVGADRAAVEGLPASSMPR